MLANSLNLKKPQKPNTIIVVVLTSTSELKSVILIMLLMCDKDRGSLGDIGFVNVKLVSSNGLEILSNKEEYLGEVQSDDFELANFDVLFKSTVSSITAEVSYKDFDNKDLEPCFVDAL